MMKLLQLAPVCALLIATGHGFVVPSPRLAARRGQLMTDPNTLKSSNNDENAERMKAILAEESINPTNMAKSAEQLKSMKPEDMDKMVEEMEQMNPAQQAQLKAMGMDPEMMKTSMQMMRDNPSMMESVGKMMENMTPEQLLEQSRMAQEKMANMSPQQVQQAATMLGNKDNISSPSQQVDEAVPPETIAEESAKEDATAKEETPVARSAADPAVIDSMFRVAELMSQPPTGGVTFAAFSTLPAITVLSGEGEMDLSRDELAECWADGSLGATRVDRKGFERVWNEVQDYFEGDIMEEARKTAKKSSARKASSTTDVVPTSAGVPAPPTVGAELTPEQLSAVNNQVKNMSDEDMGAMLDAMGDMSPEQEARMKAMGVNTAMMQTTAKMMKNNSMMRKAATAMMKNMSPEQMQKTSQQAQQQMANLSQEDIEKAMEKMQGEQGEK